MVDGRYKFPFFFVFFFFLFFSSLCVNLLLLLSTYFLEHVCYLQFLSDSLLKENSVLFYLLSSFLS